MDDEHRLEFRDALTRFVRTYSFVSQIAAFTDPALERDYIYCRALSLYLRDTGTVERLDLGAEVELTHLRHQMTFSGTLSLTSEIGEVRSFFGEGKGGQQELDLEHLSSIVEVLNERFGTDLTDVDKLLLRPVRGELGRRRRAVGSGPEQQHRQLPLVFRPQVPADDRHPRGRQRARSSRRSSTTRTSASCLATTTSGRSTTSSAKRLDSADRSAIRSARKADPRARKHRLSRCCVARRDQLPGDLNVADCMSSCWTLRSSKTTHFSARVCRSIIFHRRSHFARLIFSPSRGRSTWCTVGAVRLAGGHRMRPGIVGTASSGSAARDAGGQSPAAPQTRGRGREPERRTSDGRIRERARLRPPDPRRRNLCHFRRIHGPRTLTIHGRIQPSDRIRIEPPSELPTPIMAADLDSEYASAALSVMNVGDEKTGRRVTRAAEWLDIAWQNTSSITHDARILALRSGFEVLLSISDTGDSTRQLGTGLSQLLDEPQAPRQQRMWSERGQSRSATLTDLEWWFQSFTLLRNAIAHGHIVTREGLRFDGGGLHVFIGESTLRRSIKRTIARWSPRRGGRRSRARDPRGLPRPAPQRPRRFLDLIVTAVDQLLSSCHLADSEGICGSIAAT